MNKAVEKAVDKAVAYGVNNPNQHLIEGIFGVAVAGKLLWMVTDKEIESAALWPATTTK